jgi:uncharacterized protein YvpB
VTIIHRITSAARKTVVVAVIGAASVTGIAGASVGFAAAANATPVIEVHREGVYGDPAAAAQFWQRQNLTDDCVLMSVANVVGELTGDLPTEREVITVAAGTPSAVHDGVIYTPNQDDDRWGTSYKDAVVLLARYGITATYTNAKVQKETGVKTGMDALTRQLEAGHKVIVGLNPATIWNTSGDRTKATHAVVVTGVDTVNNIVHLNDPYPANGADLQVPLETFQQAWDTGADIMIVTQEAA